MEVVVVGAFLNTVLPKLWDAIQDAHGLRLQIRGDIDYLKEQLPMVDACIQEHKLQCPSPSSEVTEQVISKARRLAEDTEECISRFLLYQAHARLRWKMNHSEFAVKIKGYRDRLEKIIEELFNLKQVSTPKEPPDLQFGKQQFVGMNVPYQELLELLGCILPVEGEEPAKIGKGKLKVISIVGFRGSGKTRLADHVYNKARDQFGWQAWVRMEERNANEVLEEILKIIRDKPSTDGQHVNNGSSTSTGVQHVDNGSKQRYLIVIDGVQSTDHWRTLMEALPDGHVGSRIIVTTTTQSVAEHCTSSGGHVYNMSTLSVVDSVGLFSDASNRNELSPADEKELSGLVKTCDGLPLALIESGNFFEGKTVEETVCVQAVRNLCHPEVRTGGSRLTRMQWVLMNNYSGLTSNGARACLLYFRMFPSDNPTKRKSLIRRWLAEGLVQRNGLSCSDLDAASNYLQTFSDSNIIQPMQVSYNATVKSCRLPGMMYEFISSKRTSQDFVTFLNHAQDSPDRKDGVRRLSLNDGAAASGKCIDGVDVSLLRTLTVSGKACKIIMDFPQYELLRVLDLKEWDYQDDVKGICKSKCKGVCRGKCKLAKEGKLRDKLTGIWKLVMLKYLGLPGSIGEVPRKIGYLKYLETLDVGETKNIVKVYGEVIKLPKLKHLLGYFRLSTDDSPENWVPADSRLETLSGFVINKKAAFPTLMEHMKQLQKVKMWCDSNASKKKLVRHLSIAIKKFILQGIDLSNSYRALSIDVEDCSNAQFLESLDAPGRLTKLKLHGSLEKVPKFIRSLDGVKELCLSSTTLSGKFLASLAPGMLRYLKYLKLVEDELKDLNIPPNHFPSLERICLVGKKSLDGITIEDGALQRLDSLHIMCKALDGLAGIQIQHLKKLEEIALDSGVTQKTKDDWKKAAKGHQNEPRVLFSEGALRTDLSSSQVQSVPSHRWYHSLNCLQGSSQPR